MPYRICLISLGCAKNQVNSEQMLYLLNQAGHDVVGEVDGCDVAIVNTCGFIDTAKSEAIDQILQLAEVKKAGGLKKILVAGCLSQRYNNDILESLPEVDGMLGTGSFGEICQAVELGSVEGMPAFCRGIQAASPGDSYAAPEPSPEPGYTDEVIMASGSFTQGSTIELSCDGPLREPYTCYLQGGLNFAASRAGVLLAIQKAYFKD